MSLLIADAGPLIALAKIEKLELLKQLYGTVTIPQQVYSELEIGSNRPGAKALEQALLIGLLISVKTKYPPIAIISESVDAGEAEAITLAIEQKSDCPQLLIDDRKGRLVAKHHNIIVIGTAGILLIAKKQGLLVQIKPVLEQLLNVGYRISDPLCNKILQLAGEV